MPAFSVVGSYVATTVLGLAGTAAVVVGAIVATGAAYITSRVINGNPNKGANSAQNQGGRIQVPPATNNKIPVVYGNAYVNGIITDARLISLENKVNDVMYYCIVLSETCNNESATYSIDDVYWNDLRLTYLTDTTETHIVKDGRKNVDNPDTSIEDFIDTNFIVDTNRYAEMRIYAGGSTAAHQIFPTNSGNKANAYNYWGSSPANPNGDGSWTSANEMKGLVFAIVRVRYSGEKGFTGLPNVTFQLNNTINNPADVWYDYMTGSRYGANVPTTAIDTTPTTSALDQWRDYCDELITYTPVGGGSTTQKRYTINGVIDTARPVKDNIDIILQNGGAWLSYDVSTGLWEPIPKRAATVGELASALEFTDDNIISGITLSSTRLEDLYNMFEVEFFDKYNRDQKAYARLALDAEDRNPNEPDNQLRMSLDLVNNSVQAELLGQLELRQSRDDLVVEFTTNQYGIQAQAGDVIKITSDLYDWSPKLFRVMRVKEQETDTGGLVASIQALEYNADVYSVEPITEFTTAKNIGIGVYGASPYLPLPPAVVIATVDADAPIPNFELQVTIPTEGGPFDEIELYYAQGWDEMLVTGSIVPGTGSNGAPVGKGLLTITNTPYGHINAGDRIDLATDIFIESQITNTVVSKTFVSGGAPASDTSTLLTLNNVTGLLIGNTLTGTGIEQGSFIIDIDTGTNTVRIEDAVTVQASGTYYVTGGLGTYIVDTSTTLSGSAYLFDFPEADNYKLLKKLVPEGNDPTFTNGTIVRDTITNVPANSSTERRWFVKARMGIKKRFGAFSNPGDTDFDQGRFPYSPNPVASGALGDLTDVTLTTPTLGDFLWYDGTKWINENETRVDTTARTLRLTRENTAAGEDYEDEVALRLNDRVTDAPDNITDDGGPAIRFERSSGVSGTPVAFGQITMEWFGTTNDHRFRVVTSTDEFAPGSGSPPPYPNSPVLIESTRKYSKFNEGVLYVDAVNDRVGINKTNPSYELDVNGSANIDDNLYVTGSTYLGNDYITDATYVVGDFDVTNNSVSNLFVDHTTGYVGINDNTPSTHLTVAGGLYQSTSVSGERPVFQYDNSSAGVNNVLFLRKNYGAGTYTTDDGVGLALQLDSNTQNTNTVAVINTAWNASAPTVNLATNINDNTTGPFVTVASFSSAAAYVNGDLTVNGNDIKSSTATALTLSGADVNVAGDLTITGNDIKKSGGTTVVTFSGTNLTTFAGDIVVSGNTIQSSTTAALELSGANVEVVGDLTVTGNDIKSSGGTTAITLSGATVSMPDDLTVDSGTLFVDASTNRVGINNLTPTVALDVTGSILASASVDANSLLATNRIDGAGVLELYSTGFGPSVETQVFYYTASGTSLQTVNTWATVSYITGKYTISMRKGTDYHCMDIMVLHDGTTAYMNTYSEMFTNASLATFTVDISAGNVRLRVTPATVGSLEIVLERKLFIAI